MSDSVISPAKVDELLQDLDAIEHIRGKGSPRLREKRHAVVQRWAQENFGDVDAEVSKAYLRADRIAHDWILGRNVISNLIAAIDRFAPIDADIEFAMREARRYMSGSEPDKPAPVAVSHEGKAVQTELCNCGEFCALGLYGQLRNGERCRREERGMETRIPGDAS